MNQRPESQPIEAIFGPETWAGTSLGHWVFAQTRARGHENVRSPMALAVQHASESVEKQPGHRWDIGFLDKTNADVHYHV